MNLKKVYKLHEFKMNLCGNDYRVGVSKSKHNCKNHNNGMNVTIKMHFRCFFSEQTRLSLNENDFVQ